MKPLVLMKLACLMLLMALLGSCDKMGGDGRDPAEVTKFFQKRKCGSSPDWAIEQKSTLRPKSWDHVITVHSFVDDYSICKELVDYLNQNTNDTYRAVPLTQISEVVGDTQTGF
jgi:hypothetical protein